MPTTDPLAVANPDPHETGFIPLQPAGRLQVSWETAAPAKANRGRGQTLYYGWFGSPFGSMLVIGDVRDLVGIAFRGDNPRQRVLQSMQSCWPKAVFVDDPAPLSRHVESLGETGDARIRLIGTPRQHDVWRELLAIPRGETRSYGDLARRLGTRKGARWIGQANGANPVSWLVPCHRVIGHDGRLAGYGWGTDVKRAMLRAEGVRIPT